MRMREQWMLVSRARSNGGGAFIGVEWLEVGQEGSAIATSFLAYTTEYCKAISTGEGKQDNKQALRSEGGIVGQK